MNEADRIFMQTMKSYFTLKAGRILRNFQTESNNVSTVELNSRKRQCPLTALTAGLFKGLMNVPLFLSLYHIICPRRASSYNNKQHFYHK